MMNIRPFLIVLAFPFIGTTMQAQFWNKGAKKASADFNKMTKAEAMDHFGLDY